MELDIDLPPHLIVGARFNIGPYPVCIRTATVTGERDSPLVLETARPLGGKFTVEGVEITFSEEDENNPAPPTPKVYRIESRTVAYWYAADGTVPCSSDVRETLDYEKHNARATVTEIGAVAQAQDWPQTAMLYGIWEDIPLAEGLRRAGVA